MRRGGMGPCQGADVPNCLRKSAVPRSPLTAYATGAVVTEAHEDLSGVGERPPHHARDGHHGLHKGVQRDQPHESGHQPQHESTQRGNKWWTLVAVCLGTFMLLLDITIVNVALPDIQTALHSSFRTCSGWSMPTP